MIIASCVLLIRSKILASNFRIISYNFDNTLFLRLTGDFDGDSAQVLINTLLEHTIGFSDIYIETNNLKTIHSFDRDIFQKNIDSIKNQVKNLFIIGVNKYKLIQDSNDSVH
jgi:hypothetical protein